MEPTDKTGKVCLETILLVEDNEADRELATRTLNREGYRVLEARDGEEALKLYEVHGPGVDLVLTDIIMPRMDGVELVERIREMVPKVKVLFTSGYARNPRIEQKIAGHKVNFIEKSYDLSALLKKVREILDEPKSIVEWLKKAVSR